MSLIITLFLSIASINSSSQLHFTIVDGVLEEVNGYQSNSNHHLSIPISVKNSQFDIYIHSNDDFEVTNLSELSTCIFACIEHINLPEYSENSPEYQEAVKRCVTSCVLQLILTF